jgi:hypothetical protein
MSNHDREGSHPSNRDAVLERAWREASDELPPAHLDVAIIAAARKSVPDRGEKTNTGPVHVQSRSWLMQWQPLAAAAAVAGLAFVLVQMLPREHDLAPPMQRKESAPVPPAATPEASSSPVSTVSDNSQLPSADKTVAPPARVAVPDRAPAQSAVTAPSAAPAPPAATAEAIAADTAAAPGATSVDRREAIEPEMAGRTATAAAAAQSPRDSARNLGNAASLDAAAWAAKIVALQASGDFTAAKQALRAFRAADPAADTYLPDSLRDWARTVE